MTRLDIERPWPVDPPHSNTPHRSDPLWAVFCLWAGMFILVGSGAIMLVLIAFRLKGLP